MKYKMIWVLLLPLLCCTQGWTQGQPKKVETDFSIELGLNLLGFFQDGSYPSQKVIYPSLSLRPKFSLNWTAHNGRLSFEGFGRYDINGNSRTHLDIRELYYQTYQGNWELNVGVKRLYWGKLETIKLVDVINQVDFLEGIDGEEKLGQLLVEVVYASNFGNFSFFALPHSRRIAFGNAAGRPRTPMVIEDRQVSFQSSHEMWHPTLALRWSHYLGNADLGVHYFYGNAREPLIQFAPDGDFGLQYPIAHQLGIDFQIILSNTLIKLEALYRAGDFAPLDNIIAVAGGIEYTFGNVNDKGLDIGLLGEYIYDNRRELTFSSLDNDLFLGSRITLNNEAGTELILGAFKDLQRSSLIGRIEMSQRVFKDSKISLESQFFVKIDPTEFVYLFRRDSNLAIEWIRYF
ncbi:MAG: hypothetical protein AAF985_03430 [Bacteroidota bacterium]